MYVRRTYSDVRVTAISIMCHCESDSKCSSGDGWQCDEQFGLMNLEFVFLDVFGFQLQTVGDRTYTHTHTRKRQHTMFSVVLI